MTPGPRRGTVAGDVVLALQRRARLSGENVQELQTLYVLESLLARLAESSYREDFVLKGGVLLAAYALRRPTKDIDLQASGLTNDADEVASRLREIAMLDVPDGVVFDPESLTAAVIRDDDEYAGVRVKLVGTLGRSRLTIGVDVNFGDPIVPAPNFIELPRVLEVGRPPVSVLGYPLTMVLAEKIVTAIERGEGNTRWRDFADVYTLTRVHRIQIDDLVTSFRVVAAHRRVELGPLMPYLAEMPQRAQPKWAAWRARVQRDDDLPVAFEEVLTIISGFADPVLAQAAGEHSP